MIYIRNILLLVLRLSINAFCKIIRSSFRFDFDHAMILEKNYAKGMPFYFIQVGANDGVQHDNLYEFVKERNSMGVVIEPLKEYYCQLERNYRFNRNIVPVNKAVHKYKKEVQLYKVHPDKLYLFPSWAGGIGSLDKEHHKRSGIPTDAIVSETVEADDFISIFSQYYQHDIIDLIQIDVEGYDFEILKMIDFNRINPDIIKLEFKNLTSAEVKASTAILKKHNYYCFFQIPDLIGVKLHKLLL